jgi:tetratricopeptide (TPR) repeat protein
MKVDIVRSAGVVARRLRGRQFADAVAAGDHARNERRWSEAVWHYQRAVSARPNLEAISVQLGHALKESGDFEGAEQAYLRFHAAHPADADIHLQMGHLYWVQEKFGEARRWYELAEKLDTRKGNIASDARRALSQIDATPYQKEIRAALRLTDNRDWLEAHRALSYLVERRQHEDLVGILANVSKEAGLFDQAERYYSRYRAFAAGKTADIVFDAELQSGHFEKIRGNIASALGHYIRARKVLPDAHRPSYSSEDLLREINHCLGELCSVLEPFSTY